MGLEGSGGHLSRLYILAYNMTIEGSCRGYVLRGYSLSCWVIKGRGRCCAVCEFFIKEHESGVKYALA